MQRKSPRIALAFAALLVLSSTAAAQQAKCQYGRAGDGKCNAAPVKTGSITTKGTGGNTTGKSSSDSTTGKTPIGNKNPVCKLPPGSKAKCPPGSSSKKTRR
jgi:hypothetical protein